MQSPPSPALSFCDTMSSPELDLYLDSLPPLSSLPSPTMRDAWWNEQSVHGRYDSCLSDSASSHSLNANVLCNISTCDNCSSVTSLPAIVTQFLTNSRMSIETVALAFNILSHHSMASMHCWHDSPEGFASEQMRSKMFKIHGPESDASCQRALIILSALTIAVSFAEDHSRSLFHWSRQVAEGMFSTEQIGSMKRLVLAQLDWHINPLATPQAIADAIKALSDSASAPSKELTVLPPVIFDDELRLLISPGTTILHGLVTPEPTPDCTLDRDDQQLPYLLPVTPM